MTAPIDRVTVSTESVDSASEGLVRATGRTFVLAFCGALRSLRLYPADNPIVAKSVLELHAAAAALATADGEMELRIAGEFLFVNQTRLRLDLDNYATIAYLVARFRASGTGMLRSRVEATPADWLTLVTALNTPAGTDATARHHGLRQRLTAAGVTRFAVELPVKTEESGSGDEVSADLARGTYARSVAAAADVMHAIARGQSPNLRALKRTVQLIVDRILTDEAAMLGLTTVRDYEDPAFTHAVNVSIFSVALGRRLGLTRAQLYDLGLSALFHDCGKSRVPEAVLGKKEALTADDWRLITGHTWLGVLTLFQVREQGEYPYHAMLVAYEHHLKADGGGYPRRLRARPVGLYSRIVGVIEMFDAATTNLGYRTPVKRPAEYVAEMRTTADTFLDPTCVRTFVEMVGAYPVGSVMVLDTFELAISRGVNPDPELPDRPLVFIVSDQQGALLFPGRPVDLGDTDADGRYTRSIIETIDPERYGICVGDYFVA
ncbi:MAG: HD domain-containing protein [Gemmatimonadetes bacterium]|nr:HD domain-containing protein [Gemmatimonadota bacterium]